jgi:hypothetical protein
MTSHTKATAVLRPILAMIMVITATTGHAETWPFRVAFEDVPGVEQLTSGDVSGGIATLKAALENDTVDRGFGLATLCGALIIDQSLHKAEKICSEAVATLPGRTAYNNRGVLRAFTGDYAGAKEDFERARPKQLDEYMVYLKTRDVGLIADDNFGLLDKLVAKHSEKSENTSVAMKAGARIESFDD